MSEVIERIKKISSDVFEHIRAMKNPTLKTPVRSLQNVKYDKNDGFFELKGKEKVRTLTASTVKTFAQTLLMMSLSKELIESDDMATKREAYYVSKNWDDARFKEQPESDSVMDEIEAMMGYNREQMKFIPEEKGGEIAGQLVVIDKDPDTGKDIRIDCTAFGSGAYSIPISVEGLKFETNAKFILAIETAGMFQRLVKHKFWKNSNCILVSLGGVPTRACRRFIRRLSDDKKLPVYVFTDGDFYGYMNIYRTLKVGSGNSAHINEYFCVPEAKFIGITPQDIVNFKLPTHPMKDVDIKRGKDALKNDPFVHNYKRWQKAINDQIKLKKRAEQQ
ncbi:MAG: DNA topoisomerase VI, partial [Nanoarchaeota archaeon]